MAQNLSKLTGKTVELVLEDEYETGDPFVKLIFTDGSEMVITTIGQAAGLRVEVYA